jgi:geranylgeranyl diphosphate synthase type II
MTTSTVAALDRSNSLEFKHILKELMIVSTINSGDKIASMLDYHFTEMGSCQRAILCIETALLLNIEDDQALKLASIVESLHNASLIHDDIQDQDTTRRQSLSLWFKYGSDLALCAGDSLILGACQSAAELEKSSQLNISIEILSRAQQTIRGQTADVSVDKKLTPDAYRRLAIDKAAPLIQLAVTLPCLYAGNTSYMNALSSGAERFALAYQLYDDILDVESDVLNHQPNAVSLSLYEHRNLSLDDSFECAKAEIIQEAYILLNKAEFELLSIKQSCAQALILAVKALRRRLACL